MWFVSVCVPSQPLRVQRAAVRLFEHVLRIYVPTKVYLNEITNWLNSSLS